VVVSSCSAAVPQAAERLFWSSRTTTGAPSRSPAAQNPEDILERVAHARRPAFADHAEEAGPARRRPRSRPGGAGGPCPW